MAIAAETTQALNSLTWMQQAGITGVAGAAATATSSRIRKTRTERTSEHSALAEFLPLTGLHDGIEAGLQTSIRDAIATLNTLVADDRINGALQEVLGDPTDPASISTSVRNLTDAFADLAASPGKSPDAAVKAALAFTERLKETTGRIQALRGKVDSEIGKTVEQANAILRQIADLNTRITVDQAVAGRRDGLDVERDATLDSLANNLDFSSFNRADGTVLIFTKTGTPLVNGRAARLEHRATANIDATMTLANGKLSGITADGVDISEQITAGTLHALLRTRDTTLPNVQSQLDTLAQTLLFQINQISNRTAAALGMELPLVGSRQFAAPGHQRFSLSGGDVTVEIRTADGAVKGSGSLTTIVKQYQMASGLPASQPWPVSHVAAAFDRWMKFCLGGGIDVSTSIDDEGRLSFRLPQSAAGTSLILKDQRSQVFRSAVAANPDKSLGLTGPISFTDDAGNALGAAGGKQCVVQPGDSLSAIAQKLQAIDGLKARVEAVDGGFRLSLDNANGNDMSVDPDSGGFTAVRGLSLRPAADQPAEDVVVNFHVGRTGANLASAPQANAMAPLSMQGPFTLRDLSNEVILHLDVDPAWPLSGLANRISEAGAARKISAAVATAGNRYVMKISPGLGQQIHVDGEPGAYHTPVVELFSATGGLLTISLGGEAVGQVQIPAGSDFHAVAEAINGANATFEASGIAAATRSAGRGSYLEVFHRQGLPLGFGGSAIGKTAGCLNFNLNIRDRLGLVPPAQQMISGLANFLGLADLFVALPIDAFDSKAPTGIFTSTAVAGTAGALAFGPIFHLRPAQLADPSLAVPFGDLLRGPMNLAAAGGLPRGNHSAAHYAELVLSLAQAQCRDTRNQVVFQQTLLAGLTQQRAQLAQISMDETVAMLTAYQQAYQDSSAVVSTMKQLFGSLGASLH
jgi:flagellar hook-associated protein FlgK